MTTFKLNYCIWVPVSSF